MQFLNGPMTRARACWWCPPEEMFKAGASGRKMIDDDAIRAAANKPWRETAQF
jgi:hypothetical protein